MKIGTTMIPNEPNGCKEKMNEEQDRGNGYSPMNIIGFGAGLYHGYCESQGIQMAQSTETLCAYGPLAASGLIGGTLGALAGGLVGANKTGIRGGLAGIVAGTVIGGGVSAAVTGIATLIGYGVGYTTGCVLR